MKKAFLRSKTVIVLVLALLALSMTSLAQGQTGGTPTRTSYHSQTGQVRFIGSDASAPIYVAGASQPGLRGVDRAGAVLNTFAPQFGISNPQTDLMLKSETASGNTLNYRYQQLHFGVPVFGGQLVVNMTANGGLLSVGGEVANNLSVAVAPKFTSNQAVRKAVNSVAKRYNIDAATLSATTPELWVLDPRLEGRTGNAQLVWRLDVVGAGRPLRQFVMINATNGRIVKFFNQIDTGWFAASRGQQSLDAVTAAPAYSTLAAPSVEFGPRVLGTPTLSTYTMNNQNSNQATMPGTALCENATTATATSCTGGTDTDGDEAHFRAYEVYNFYATNFNRDSLDNAGLELISSVHYDTDYCNAFWNGTQMAYGDGCGSTIVLDDVVGHELTHGVTDFTSGLIYENQSGAINEALSDIFGELYDLTNASGDETAGNRWAVGEELGGIRNMKTPGDFGDPDSLNSPNFYHGSGDNFGVHINSGVANKATYLMVDGDTFNGYTINSIGAAKTLQIWYRVQTNYLTSMSDYNDLYDYLNQACQDLVDGAAGITLADCVQVDNAAKATEMNQHLTPYPAPRADICPAGALPVDDYFENFEGSPKFTLSANTAVSTRNAWKLKSANFPLSGGYSLRGVNLYLPSDSFAAMAVDVRVMAGSYLHFDHKFRFEGFNYDGGFVEYSTNSGTSWNKLETQFDSGLDYNGTLSIFSPQAGQTSFIDFSGGGVAATRYDLSTLAGQKVRFRFRLVTDDVYGDLGWWIDNVRVYTCADASSTELLVNGGFEAGSATAPHRWTPANAANDKAVCGTGVGNTGSCAYRFTGNVSTTTTLTQTVNNVDASIGDGLELSAMVKHTGTTKIAIKATVYYLDPSFTTKVITKTQTAATGGIYIPFFTNLVLPAQPDRVKVQVVYSAAAGKVDIDDVSLRLYKTIPREAQNGQQGDGWLPLPGSN